MNTDFDSGHDDGFTIDVVQNPAPVAMEFELLGDQPRGRARARMDIHGMML
jgi:hypothetical protein